jgi:hypothetical protein
MSYIVTNPFKLMVEEDRCKYSQAQHNILIRDYEKSYILEKQIFNYMEDIKNEKDLETLESQLDKHRIAQIAVYDFMNNDKTQLDEMGIARKAIDEFISAGKV